MAKFTVYEKVSGKKHRCEGAEVKELTEGENAFYTMVDPKADTSPPAADPEAEAKAHDEKIKVIVEAIKLLDPKDSDHFTEKGLPRDAAIELILGHKVSKEERAEAWNIVQASK